MKTVVFAVVASTFFVGFGGGVIFPILPNLGAVLGISAFMVGLILSATRLTRLAANAPAGALVDRYGTRKPFVAGLAVQAIATLGYIIALLVPAPEDVAWLAHSLYAPGPLGPEHWLLLLDAITAPETWFLLARLLWGAGSATIMATAYTIVTNVSPQDSRGTYMGVVRGGLLLGFPSGLVLGGVVSGIAGEITAFGLSTSFAVVAVIVAFILVPETHVVHDTDTSIKPWEIETATPALTVGFVNCALMFAYAGTLFATLVLFLDEKSIALFGLGPQGSSGIFMAGTVLSAGGAMVVGGWVSDTRGSRVPVLIVFLMMVVLGFLFLARTDTLPELVVACLCIGVGQGGTSGPMIALLADLIPEDRMGRASGTNNVLGDVGGVIGPMVSLPLVDLIGFSPIYLISALMPLLAGLILLVGVRKETGSLLPRSVVAD